MAPKSKPKAKTPTPKKAESLRVLVRSVLSDSQKKFFDKLDANDPEFLKTMIEATGAQYMASVETYRDEADPAYRAAASSMMARHSEELRKLLYLRVQAESDTGPQEVSVRILGIDA